MIWRNAKARRRQGGIPEIKGRISPPSTHMPLGEPYLRLLAGAPFGVSFACLWHRRGHLCWVMATRVQEGLPQPPSAKHHLCLCHLCSSVSLPTNSGKKCSFSQLYYKLSTRLPRPGTGHWTQAHRYTQELLSGRVPSTSDHWRWVSFKYIFCFLCLNLWALHVTLVLEREPCSAASRDCPIALTVCDPTEVSPLQWCFPDTWSSEKLEKAEANSGMQNFLEWPLS